MDNHVDYKQKYKTLKKKLKFLVYEQECFLEELRKAQRKLLKISRDRSFLLDRLLQYEKIDESSGDSDATASSESDGEGSSSNRKRKNTGGSMPFGLDGAVHPAVSATEPMKKRAKTAVKKGANKGKVKAEGKPNPMTREELERHLESKQNAFGIEKAPPMLPMEIFSNDNSNPDSESAQDTAREEDDSDLIVDTGI